MLQFDKNGSIQAASSPTAQAYEGDPPTGQCPIPEHGEGQKDPVQMTDMQPGMHISGRRSQPSIAGTSEHNVEPQPIVASAGQPTAAAGQLAPARSMLESQQSEEEVCRIRKELAAQW